MFQLGWVDFNTYCPIILKSNDQCFVFEVATNADFDNAKQSEKFTCYPVKQTGEVDLTSVRVFEKEEIQSVPVPV
ncbi:MAG: hypothetical protein ACO1OF_12955 [Adhaeribacter sp.]